MLVIDNLNLSSLKLKSLCDLSDLQQEEFLPKLSTFDAIQLAKGVIDLHTRVNTTSLRPSADMILEVESKLTSIRGD